MAVAFQNKTSNSTSGASSLTVSHTASGSNLIAVVAISADYGASGYTTSVTYNGVSMTQAIEVQPTFDAGDSSIWYLVNPATGTQSVVANFASSTRNTQMVVYTFTGASQSSPIDNSGVNGNSASTSIAKSITTNVDGCMVVDALSTNQGASTPTANGDNSNATTALGHGSSYATKATAGSVNMSWSTNSGTNGIAVVSIAPSSSSTSLPYRTLINVGK